MNTPVPGPSSTTGVVSGVISEVINAASALLDGVIDATRIGSVIHARRNCTATLMAVAWIP